MKIRFEMPLSGINHIKEKRKFQITGETIKNDWEQKDVLV